MESINPKDFESKTSDYVLVEHKLFDLRNRRYVPDCRISQIYHNRDVLAVLNLMSIYTLSNLAFFWQMNYKKFSRFSETKLQELEKILVDYYVNDPNWQPMDGIPYYQIYHVNPEDYSARIIERNDFSARLRNRLVYFKLKSLEDVLYLDDETLMKVHGFGENSRLELHTCLERMLADPHISNAHPEETNLPFHVNEYREQILNGNFSFVEGKKFAPTAMLQIQSYREAYEALDKFLVQECVNRSAAVMKLVDCLEDYCQAYEVELHLAKILNAIPPERLNRPVSYLLSCYRAESEDAEYLLSRKKDDKQSLYTYIDNGIHEKGITDPILNDFGRWCGFDMAKEWQEHIESVRSNERDWLVLQGRSQGWKLQKIGDELLLSRERIRQIEAKILAAFLNWQDKKQF